MHTLSLDAFCSWLCTHEHEVVGRAGTWFHGPLALWLSESLGGVYGVDGQCYGRASWEAEHWMPLPWWAVVFTFKVDGHRTGSVLGHEAFAVLTEVEVLVQSRQAVL